MVLLAVVAAAVNCAVEAAPKKPNFVVFFTDDLDYMLNTTHPAYMPYLNEHIANKGLLLRNNLISTSGRRPSRPPHCAFTHPT